MGQLPYGWMDGWMGWEWTKKQEADLGHCKNLSSSINQTLCALTPNIKGICLRLPTRQTQTLGYIVKTHLKAASQYEGNLRLQKRQTQT